MAKPKASKETKEEVVVVKPAVVKKTARRKSVVERVYDYTSPIFKYGAIATAGLAGSVLAPGLLLNPITGAALGAGSLAYLSGETGLGKAILAGGTPYLIRDVRDYNINRELLETGISEAGRGLGGKEVVVDDDLHSESDGDEGDIYMVDSGADRKRRRSSTTSLDNALNDMRQNRQRPKVQEYVAQPIDIRGPRSDLTRQLVEFGIRHAAGHFNQ